MVCTDGGMRSSGERQHGLASRTESLSHLDDACRLAAAGLSGDYAVRCSLIQSREELRRCRYGHECTLYEPPPHGFQVAARRFFNHMSGSLRVAHATHPIATRGKFLDKSLGG